MRALPTAVFLLAAFGLSATPAAAQSQPLRDNRPAQQQLQRLQLQSERPAARRVGLTRVAHSHPGEVRRITTVQRTDAERGRLARRYKGLHVHRTRSTHTLQSVGRATPALRVVETQRERFVRVNGSHFRVHRN